MKRTLIIGLLLLAGSWARADVILTQTFGGGAVSQGNPVGTAFIGDFTAAGAGDLVLGLTVDLNVSGGYSGGFYMYLVGPDGSTTVTLLNTPGTSTYGLNIALDDTAPSPITSGSDLSSGTYRPNEPLSGLNDQSANGNWTLYFADLSSGGGDATLNSWTLNIDVVPEPITYALVVFGLAFAGFGVRRYYLGRRRSRTAN